MITRKEIVDRVRTLVDEMHGPRGYSVDDIRHGLERLLEDLEPRPAVTKPSNKEILEGMSTGRLLRELQWTRIETFDPEVDNFTKAEIKAVLATRPHVPNKVEAKKIRQEKARNRGKRRGS